MADEEEGKSEDPMAEAKSKSLMEHPAETSRNPCKFPDLAFGLAWIASVIAMLAIAFEYSTGAGEADFKDSKARDAVRKISRLLILAFLFALVVAQMLLHIMLRFGGILIHVSLLLMEILLGGVGLIAISELENWYLGAVFLILCVLMITFHCLSMPRIRNAAVTLHVGCEVVLAYPILQITAFAFACVALSFFFLFAIAIMGFYNYKQSKDEDSFKELVGPVLVFIFIAFWSQQILKYIVIATTAGTTQAWWHGNYPSLAKHPALNSLARSCSYNLGSIAFGAFFVSVIETIVLIIQYIKQKAKDFPGGCCARCCLGCVQCCLGCCAAMLDYINKYAFVYVGIHGYSYLWAGKQVVELFGKHGFVVVGADFFIDLVFFINSIIIGLVTAFFGVMLIEIGPDSWHKHTSSAKFVAGLICGVAGLFIGTVVFSVVDGANKSVMILFSENPQVLEITHPEEFKRLSASWSLLGEEIKENKDDDDAGN